MTSTVLKFSSLLFTVAGLMAAMSAVQAAPMNKCVINGTVTYQQAGCPSNQVRKEPTLEELNAAEKKRRAAVASASRGAQDEAPRAKAGTSGGFSCDGRKHCSQMGSCGEAKYFLANCPGVQMDGDRDGIPCEEQLCGH